MKVSKFAWIVLLGSVAIACAESEHYKAAWNLEREGKYEEAYSEWVKSARAGDYEDMTNDYHPVAHAFECAQKLGRFEEGVAFVDQEIARKPRGYLQYLLGCFYKDKLKDFDRSRERHQAAYDLFLKEDKPSWLAWEKYAIADAYLDELHEAEYYKNRRLRHEYWRKADANLQEALALTDTIPAGDIRTRIRRDVLKSLASLNGQEAYRGADPQKATLYREEYLALGSGESSKSGWSDVVDRAKALMEQKDFQAAKTLVDNYVAENPSRTKQLNTYWWLIKARSQAGDHEGAYQAGRDALDLIDSMRNRKRTDIEKIMAQQRPWLAYYELTMREAGKLGRRGEAAEILERSKARAMLDLLSEKQSHAGQRNIAKAEKERNDVLAQADEIRRTIERERSLGRTQEVASLTRSLVLVEDTSEKLRANVEQNRREFLSMHSVEPLSLQEIQASLGNATLIMFWMDTDVAVITSNEVYEGYVRGGSYFPKLAKTVFANTALQGQPARSLEIEGAAGSATPSAPSADFMHAAQELYRICIRPYEKYIKSDTLIISADRNLSYLPFQLFHDGEKFLVEKYAVTYVPSASVWKFCADKRRPLGNKLVALGNPNLRDPRFSLVHAEDEVNDLAAIFTNATILVGNTATEKAVQLLAPDADILHFACHGSLDEDDPNRTSLRLAPDAENDGFLHVMEIFDLDVHANLVTLSACESGLGEATLASEVLGMTRAWMYAGAPSVLASSWKVDDRATAKLMTEFYRNLATMNKAKALQAAQVKMLKEGNSPYLWAAFCLYGDYM